jgi:hypothetical protein
MKKMDVYVWCLGTLFCAFGFQSCSREDIPDLIYTHNLELSGELNAFEKANYFHEKPSEVFVLSEIHFDAPLLEDPCVITKFETVLGGHFQDLLRDPYFDPQLINYYIDLHRKYVTFYRGENYYGANAEYDKLAVKRVRELTKFWKLNREIYLNGQHTATLNDREILTDMIESFDRSVRNREQAYDKADILLAVNSSSAFIPENPVFALDAFTRSNGLLVIGDGLLEVLVETGIDGHIAFTGIISHEWWHQAQFEHAEIWAYLNNIPNSNDRSKFSELESDFAAAYFMSHKRGATYNWKKISDFFELSFNVGDCLTESPQHHGTPSQRLAAAKLGFDLAEAAQKKGAVISSLELHELFVEHYEKNIL